jgi:tetratricopeptide (TPR) repeat protein
VISELAPLHANAENLEHTQRLLSTKQCSQCELSGAGLVLANLAGANLSGADLTRANLSRANLTGADLTGANLTGASLNGANLNGANLSGANLSGSDLRDAYLVGARLYGINLNTAYVQGAVGIPEYAGTPEDFYAWGVSEAGRGNYRAAIEKFNQVLSIKPDFAPALLARGVALYRLGDESAATVDAQSAGVLFTTQGNTLGYQASQNLVKAIEFARNPPKGGGTSLGNAVVGIGSFLLQLLSPLKLF